jgi:hypothetical protein
MGTVTSENRKEVRSRMASSGMLRRVAPVRTNGSEEPSSSFITVTRIGELGTDACCEEIPSEKGS